LAPGAIATEYRGYNLEKKDTNYLNGKVIRKRIYYNTQNQIKNLIYRHSKNGWKMVASVFGKESLKHRIY
jgi:hypothetical protein